MRHLIRARSGLALIAVPAGLLAFLDFRAGGFFPDTTAIVTLAVLAVLVGVVTASPRPLAAMRARLALAVAALSAFAVWQLASASWSHAPGRAALAFGTTLLYVVALVAAGLLVDRPARMRALVLGVLAGLAAACVGGLLARTLPGVFPVPRDVANERLGWPVTYWNALGLMGSAALVLCLGLTGSEREHRAVRWAAAGLVPVLATTVYFTFSRGSIAAAAVGALVLVALSRRRALVGGLLAAAPPAAVAVVVAYHASALSRANPTGPDAVSQGHRVILVVLACALAAAALRALLDRTLDRWLAARPPVPRPVAGAAWAVVALLAIGGAAAGAATQYDRFVKGTQIRTADERSRLLDPGNNGRLDHWRVAVKMFRAHPLDGAGAGTYEVWWDRLRPAEYDVLNAHSLYLEELGEVGVIGLALLLACLAAMVVGLVLRARGPDRALWATAAAAVIAWALEAGIDWIWQMPAATAWVFALGGAALARPAAATAPAPRAPGSTARLLAGLAVLLVAVMPVRIALSQAHLRSAVGALKRGDCGAAVSGALSSAGALGARAEPYELLAYCDARLGFDALAEQMIGRAIARDPGNWQYRYDLALVRAAAGRDPHAAVAQALRLEPISGLLHRFRSAMAGNDPRTWRRRALDARLLLPG